MVVILWIFIPSILLIIFLLVASYHFGKEDAQFLHDHNSLFMGIMYFLKGSLVILAPLYFHFDETTFQIHCVPRDFLHTIYRFLTFFVWG